MLDLVYLALIVACFTASAALVRFCAALRRGSRP